MSSRFHGPFDKVTAGTGVVRRPCSGFPLENQDLSPEYILKQVSVSNATQGRGFLFGNAASDYSKPFAAMPTMRRNTRIKERENEAIPKTHTAFHRFSLFYLPFSFSSFLLNLFVGRGGARQPGS